MGLSISNAQKPNIITDYFELQSSPVIKVKPKLSIDSTESTESIVENSDRELYDSICSSEGVDEFRFEAMPMLQIYGKFELPNDNCIILKSRLNDYIDEIVLNISHDILNNAEPDFIYDILSLDEVNEIYTLRSMDYGHSDIQNILEPHYGKFCDHIEKNWSNNRIFNTCGYAILRENKDVWIVY